MAPLLVLLAAVTAAGTPAVAAPADTTTPPTPDVPDVDVGVFVYYTNETASDDVTMRRVLGPDDFARVGPVQTEDGTERVFVPVTLTDAAAERFQREMVHAGFGDGGICVSDERPGDPGECLLTVVDGAVDSAAGVQPALGRAFRDGTFAEDPEFVLTVANESEGERLRTQLDDAGAPVADREADTGTENEERIGLGLVGAFLAVPVLLFLGLRWAGNAEPDEDALDDQFEDERP